MEANMKLFLPIFVSVFLLLGNISISHAEIEEEETYGRYNALIIDYDRVTDAETLYDEIYEKLKEVEFFTKKGEGQLIIISYDTYNPKIWSQVRAIVQKENLVEMKKFLYLKDNHQGIRDAYVFWLK